MNDGSGNGGSVNDDDGDGDGVRGGPGGSGGRSGDVPGGGSGEDAGGGSGGSVSGEGEPLRIPMPRASVEDTGRPLPELDAAESRAVPLVLEHRVLKALLGAW
ncbi:MDMPI N domain containing protein, partial [Streptomyces prunicolor]